MTDSLNQSIGSSLRGRREQRGMSAAELSRVTRIPMASIEAIEADRFDELPGEVFVRGFLRAYAQAVGLLPADILARFTSSRRVAYVTPLPTQTPLQAAREGQGRRFGVAIAFVLLLILLSLALSIVLKPRGHDMPAELSLFPGSSVAPRPQPRFVGWGPGPNPDSSVGAPAPTGQPPARSRGAARFGQRAS